jgi:hypothetical protein
VVPSTFRKRQSRPRTVFNDFDRTLLPAWHCKKPGNFRLVVIRRGISTARRHVLSFDNSAKHGAPEFREKTAGDERL